MNNLRWVNNTKAISWSDLSALYKIAPLGDKPAETLELVFCNSMFTHFIYDGEKLIGAGRALADGADCSYICDIAIHPEYQGEGLGKEVTKRLISDSKEHSKIILYAVPGKESFYAKFGFSRLRTAMAIFYNTSSARKNKLID